MSRPFIGRFGNAWRVGSIWVKGWACREDHHHELLVRFQLDTDLVFLDVLRWSVGCRWGRVRWIRKVKGS